MSELREARERMRRFVESGAKEIRGSTYQGGVGQHANDEEALILNDLADHPADSDEPISEEWLRSVGFEKPDGCRENELSIGDDDLYVCFGTEQTLWMACDHYDYTPRSIPFADDNPSKGDRKLSRIPSGLWPKTRGDVRQLLAALGIITKGGAK